ncbi:VanW like protein [Sporobacter termitidis DSM 10068]|uniref:VanW like protein n=1 Tax=Sporobacter termitidis DSM 10068 TaxID=1123282 RepID=A0A1M5WV87_9FIRM|nr:VanW family protein [Sporobacter termitidis]SHH91302.1 VanW like protein [Sporobacter termitidis DSM 10068]
MSVTAGCLTGGAGAGAVPAELSGRPGFDPFLRASLLSGPTTQVPWQNDPAFNAAKKENGCTALLAAYKTVLRDPLPGEEGNVHLAARYIRGALVPPGETFSQNETAGPYTAERGYDSGPTYMGTLYSETIGGGVCKIASTLFNVAVLSDLAIVERHTHSMPVPYVPYGQDATVYYGAKDLKFKNTTGAPILIWAEGIDNILYIGFYGQSVPPELVWHHDVLNVYRAPVVYRDNTKLPKGTEHVLHEGMDGAAIRSWITRFHSDGTSDVREMGTHYYNPLSWIIERNN